MELETKAARAAKGDVSTHSGLCRTSNFESEQFYSHRLSILGRLMARTTNRMLSERFGLSPVEWRILIQLEYRSPSKISEIHERSLVKKPQISAALRLLVQRGHAVRDDDSSDARSPKFWITAEGLKLYRNVMRVTRQRQRGLELLLTKSQREVFGAALDRLITFYFEEEQRGNDGMFTGVSPDRRTAKTR